MTDHPVPADGDGTNPSGRTGLWRMLGAVSRAQSPHVHDLMLAAADRESFAPILTIALDPRLGPLRGFGDVTPLLRDGAGIELLRAIKESAKRAVGPEADPNLDPRAALLSFALAVGALLRHHDVLSTRADRASLEDLFLGLCGCPEPWVSDLAAFALARLGEIDDREGGHERRATA